MTALDPSWLVPPGSLREEGGRWLLGTEVTVMPAGVLWDAVRTPLDLGERTLARLRAFPNDRALLGPVLSEPSRRWLYWLISPGASDDWPSGVRLLTAGHWIAAHPSVFDPTQGGPWLHLPDQRIVSSPPWLATAFTLAPATPEPTMRLHADDAQALDTLAWEPGLCAIGGHDRSETVVVAGDRLCRDCLGYRMTLQREFPLNAAAIVRAEEAAGVVR